MAQINTNMISLNAQRNLGVTQSALATSIQRLSSGLRVNSAKDDAAGLAIAERMNTQVRGMNVAIRNANDGISLAQTAEGALGKVGDMLQRMRELAVQSANATNTDKDREALNAEVTALKAEIGRMADTTSFNGVNILDGSFTNKSFQVGANSTSSDRINVDKIANASLSSLGGALTLNTKDVTLSSVLASDAVAGAFKVKVGGEEVSLDAVAAVTETITGSPTSAELNAQAQLLADAVNAVSGKTGVKAEVDADKITFTSATAFEITGAPIAAVGAAAANPTMLDDVNVSSVVDSRIALETIDSAITTISSARADMGALQSRFESVIGNLQISSENIAAARGRIMDTDFAAETANLSRAQVLQQAGMAMLSQANAVPQNVLSLLR